MASPASDPKPAIPKPPRTTARDYAEIGAALLVVFGLFLVLRRLDILPEIIALPSSIGYGLAFMIGVAASLSTCMAVTGGLLVAIASKFNEVNPRLTSLQRLQSHLYFNAGRLVSYAVLGGSIGALGSVLLLSQEMNGVITITVSMVMVVLGLQMLRLLPRVRLLPPALSKSLTQRFQTVAAPEAKGGAFLLGASTFFLPCGFTQALQLYVLVQGNAWTGALIMLAFALGTLPALLSLSALSSFARAGFQKYFLKVAGAAVLLLGLFNIQNGLTLAGYPIVPGARPVGQASAKLAPLVDGKQIAEMKIVEYGYEPFHFVVKQGIPVQWQIDAHDAAGCGLILIAPNIAVRKFLSPRATNIISFVPQQAGEIAFNCGMGMMTPGAKFIVVPHAKS
jgi:sulfite exporter TauE/SafE